MLKGDDKNLRILHVVPSLDAADGGPTVATQLLAKAVASRGYRVAILATQRAGSLELATASSSIGEQGGAKSEERRGKGEVEYVYAKRSTGFYKASFELVKWLRANIQKFDLVHIHALFSFSSTAAAFIAHRAGVDYIVRPLGVLNQWGLKNRRSFLKRASLALIEKRILAHASSIHYTSEAERRDAAQIGAWVAELPSFICPLPVETERAESEEQRAKSKEYFLNKFSGARDKRIVLFLSRIDRKKGIELLLEAFASVRPQFEDIVLVIAGSGETGYETSLRNKAMSLGIADSVVWTGFVDGDLKSSILSFADIFVLPSYSENFGIAAAEAMAAGVPCVLSDKVALIEFLQHGESALITSCDAAAIEQAISRLLSDDQLRARIAANGEQIASQQFSSEAVGHQLLNMYRAIVEARKQTSNIERPTSNAQ